jgi:hypothetical protein
MSGITRIFLDFIIWSPSKVDDPLDPSATSLALIKSALVLLIANSKAAGKSTSHYIPKISFSLINLG